VIYAHIEQAPDDFFVEDLTKCNFLCTCLLSLCEICDSESVPSKIRKRIDLLRELIRIKFKVDIDDIMALSEDAPVVVDIS